MCNQEEAAPGGHHSARACTGDISYQEPCAGDKNINKKEAGNGYISWRLVLGAVINRCRVLEASFSRK